MLRLFNSLTRQKEPFLPETSPVTIYVCGVTPYDTTHAGHAFTYVVFDVLHRYLRFLGHEVRYVSNITDVDDSILERARQRGLDYRLLGKEQTAQFFRDMADLHVLEPDVRPRASEEIPQMIQVVERMLEQGTAYVAGGGWVYFSVDRFPNYGQLGKYDRDEMTYLSAERGGDPSDPRKRDPLDFVLWQPSLPDEPSWEAPWGGGRPGWHLECTAMALRYLGDSIDIHGGGADLIFPHHESEIAQSELYTGAPFARFWMHTGMVRLDGHKMSKSLGNLVLVRDLLTRHSAAAIRLHLLSNPYREGWDFDERDELEMDRLAARVAEAAGRQPDRQLEENDPFLLAMDDDLATPAAIQRLKERLVEAEAGDASASSDLAIYRTILGI